MIQHFDNYFFKAVHRAKIEQLIETYSETGFEEENGTNGKTFDLLLRHKTNQKRIAFQVTIHPISKEESAEIDQAESVAKEKGYDFHLVTIVKPRAPTIEIEWLKEKLLAYLSANILVDIKSKIEATSITIQELSLFVVSIDIVGQEAQVQVEGTLEAYAWYGSTDAGEEIFPFTADLTLNLAEQTIVKVADLKVDNCFFY